MIIVGAKGFAKEILQVLSVEMQLNDEKIIFFDDVSTDLPDLIFNRFSIIRSFDEIEKISTNINDNSFVLGVGNPILRKRFYSKMLTLNMKPTVTIANSVQVGDFDVEIGKGTSIMSGSIITNSIYIGQGCLINLNCTIGHDSYIGDFVELSPNVNISGRCKIGDYTSIGTNAIILPDVEIGQNVIVAAGAVVTKNIPDNCMVAGVPAAVKKNFNL